MRRLEGKPIARSTVDRYLDIYDRGQRESMRVRSLQQGEVSALFGTEGLNVFEGLIKDFSIEEKNGVEGLILGGC